MQEYKELDNIDEIIDATLERLKGNPYHILELAQAAQQEDISIDVIKFENEFLAAYDNGESVDSKTLYYFAAHIKGANVELIEDYILKIKEDVHIADYSQVIGSDKQKIFEYLKNSSNPQAIYHYIADNKLDKEKFETLKQLLFDIGDVYWIHRFKKEIEHYTPNQLQEYLLTCDDIKMVGKQLCSPSLIDNERFENKYISLLRDNPTYHNYDILFRYIRHTYKKKCSKFDVIFENCPFADISKLYNSLDKKEKDKNKEIEAKEEQTKTKEEQTNILKRNQKLILYFKQVAGKYLTDAEYLFNETNVDHLNSVTKSKHLNYSKEELNAFAEELKPIVKEGKKLCSFFRILGRSGAHPNENFNNERFNPPIEYQSSRISETELKRLIDAIVACYNKVAKSLLDAGLIESTHKDFMELSK